jgi:mRNA interferase YafQ
LNIVYTGQFKKDYKRLKKQGKPIDELETILRNLVRSEKLPPQNFDHNLKGKWKKYRECHIGPDWLLIYRMTKDQLCLPWLTNERFRITALRRLWQ